MMPATLAIFPLALLTTAQAQKLADEFRVEMLHHRLDEFADRYCPAVKRFGLNHWSLDQVEFATDMPLAFLDATPHKTVRFYAYGFHLGCVASDRSMG